MFEVILAAVEKNVARMNVETSKGKRQKYFLFWNEDKKEIRVIEQTGILGSGTFGKIKLWNNLHTGKKRVFKQAKRKFPSYLDHEHFSNRARQDLVREQAILKNLHGIKGKAIGIEPIPLSGKKFTAPVFNVDVDAKLTEGKSKRQYGLLKIKFQSDFFEILKDLEKSGILNSFDDCLLFSLQLLGGGTIMARKGISHGDIKAENIFLLTIGGIQYVFIGDFGGACQLSDTIENITRLGVKRAFATDVINKNDLLALDNAMSVLRLLDSSNVALIANLENKIRAIEEKADPFSLGLFIYRLFSGQSPFDFFECDGQQFLDDHFLGFGEMSIPQEIEEIISGLLLNNYEKRMLCEEAYFKLLDYVEKNQPVVFARYQTQVEGFDPINPAQRDLST
ncbi:MAG: serine/threonine-protein kinase [Silvanigrellaceae bacterium]|nr:serine/threonine-protein kinase [Silvanigrellaceae bacterium]